MKSGAELRAADECNDSKGQMWDELTEGVEYAPRSAPPPPACARGFTAPGLAPRACADEYLAWKGHTTEVSGCSKYKDCTACLLNGDGGCGGYGRSRAWGGG